jgi:hypothetical protein
MGRKYSLKVVHLDELSIRSTFESVGLDRYSCHLQTGRSFYSSFDVISIRIPKSIRGAKVLERETETNVGE